MRSSRTVWNDPRQVCWPKPKPHPPHASLCHNIVSYFEFLLHLTLLLLPLLLLLLLSLLSLLQLFFLLLQTLLLFLLQILVIGAFCRSLLLLVASVSEDNLLLQRDFEVCLKSRSYCDGNTFL